MEDYKATLGVLERQRAILEIKNYFQQELASALSLSRVSAPLFVRQGSGINDDLNGVEKPVSFHVPAAGAVDAEIVQSLAKWKRLALGRYGFKPGTGLYTDMNAVRPDEVLDNLHSIYVDQWDWEQVILPEERSQQILMDRVRKIYQVIRQTEYRVASLHPSILPVLPTEITFLSSSELSKSYPSLTFRQIEDLVAEKYGAVFIMGIGAPLRGELPYDGRAPDYDDWLTPREDGGLGLNGDIIIWNPVLKRAFELSSMGIRVNPEVLLKQLEVRGLMERRELDFHRRLLAGELPQTMGGGIGQSRLCMYYLRAAHIGEVSVGLWSEEIEKDCGDKGIVLL